jgi:hypothetical protein
MEGNFMATPPLVDVVDWVLAAILFLSTAATIFYVGACLLTATRGTDTLQRRLRLLGALTGFLCGWAFLVIAVLFGVFVAAALDVQAQPSHPENWRLLTVLVVVTFIMLVLNGLAVWAVRRLVGGAKMRLR